MWPARDQIEAPVLGLNALDLPALGFFVGDGGLNGDPFDFVVADHCLDGWR